MALKAELQHFLDGLKRPESQALLHLNGGLHRFKAVVQFLECVETHVGTGIAAASIHTRNINQRFVGNPLLHLVKDPWLRENDERV